MTTEYRTFEARTSATKDTISAFIPYASESLPIGGEFVEVLMPGAFTGALKRNNDVKALWQHKTEYPLARMKNGTMSVIEERDGIRATIKPDTSLSWGKDALQAVRSGLVDQVSFGFELAKGGDKWVERTGSLPLRQIYNVQHLYEISPVTFPAYQQTSAVARHTKGTNTMTKKQLSKDLIRRIDAVLERDRTGGTTWKNPEDFIRAIIEAGKAEISVPSPTIRPSDRHGTKPSYTDGFEKDRRITGADNRLIRATGLSEGSPSGGGWLVPNEFKDQFLFNRDSLVHHPLPGLCTHITLKSGNTIKLPSWETGVTVEVLPSEGLEKSRTKPTLTGMEPKLNKSVIVVYATDELVEDANVGAWLTTHASTHFLYECERQIIRGTGAGMAQGILNAACTQTVARAAAGAIGIADIENMWSTLYSGSKGSAVWVVNGYGASEELITLACYDEANHRLMGRPILESDHASAVGSRGDIILADMTQYVLIDKAVKQDTSIHVRFIMDETAFRFVYRWDGQPTWAAGITPPQNAAVTASPFVVLSEKN